MDSQAVADSIVSTTEMTVQDCETILKETVAELDSQPLAKREPAEVVDMLAEVIVYARLCDGAYRDEHGETLTTNHQYLTCAVEEHLQVMDEQCPE